jgi:hypothetical protein
MATSSPLPPGYEHPTKPSLDSKETETPYGSLVRQISAASLQYSQHAAPGGASHAVYFYGSPCIEQAAALGVTNATLEWLAVQTTRPREAEEFKRLLAALLAFLKALRYNHAAQWALTEPSPSWASQLIAPSMAAFEAMRQKLMGIVLVRQAM